MKLVSSTTTALRLSLTVSVIINSAEAQCGAPGTLVCQATTTTTPSPKLDGDFSDWAAVPAFTTPLFTYYGQQYEGGDATYKCLHDSGKIYFALEWPGRYRFNSSGNHQCPAMATMTKIGSRASFINMGGCPQGLTPCNNSIPFPSTCENYIVDIGAHWETRLAKQGVEYPIYNNGTGRDPASRKDDEYAVGPTCRRPDDGENASNEWAGAWTHTANTTIGADGLYRFELSRLLTTASSRTDAQLVAGNNYSFGIAIWDPYETEDVGWDEPDHYLTGCGVSWINLALIKAAEAVPTPVPVPPPTAQPVVPPTIQPVVPPTVKPVVPPTVKPVVPPTVKPVVPPTVKPVVPPTVKPVVPPTVKPVVPPTVKPVVPPTVKPVVSPTVKPVAPPTVPPPTVKPIVPPTVQPVVPPTVKPVIPPTVPPVPRPTVQPMVVPPTVQPVLPDTLQPVVVSPTTAPPVPTPHATTTAKPVVTPVSPPVATTAPVTTNEKSKKVKKAIVTKEPVKPSLVKKATINPV